MRCTFLITFIERTPTWSVSIVLKTMARLTMPKSVCHLNDSASARCIDEGCSDRRKSRYRFNFFGFSIGFGIGCGLFRCRGCVARFVDFKTNLVFLRLNIFYRIASWFCLFWFWIDTFYSHIYFLIAIDYYTHIKG